VLEGSAPTILPELVRRWVIDFQQSQSAVQVDVPPPYEPPQAALSPRLAAFVQGRLDFAFLSRKMSHSDVVTFRQAHHYDPLVIPVAGGSWSSFGLVDPVAVVVNSRNPIPGLSFAQLDAIFSKSRRRGHAIVRTWGQLGVSSLANQPIHLAGGASWLGEDSARAGVFRERVLLGGRWRDDPQAAASGIEKEVPARVAADPLAIGFTGLGHLVPGARAVPLTRGHSSSYVKPTFEAVASGRYPLARTIDLVVARQPGRCLTPALRSFVRYLLSPRGQKMVTKEGHFLPLSSAQSRLSWLRASSCS
jgi:phosphate transport system substrate-binding protein